MRVTPPNIIRSQRPKSITNSRCSTPNYTISTNSSTSTPTSTNTNSITLTHIN